MTPTIPLLDGKVAIVSGAASPRGIGLATARMFARHGAKVAILDLDENAAAEAAASIGPGHRGYACNVADLESCKAAAGRVLADFGKIDILINNAGITQAAKVMDIDPAGWDRILDVNLRGVLGLAKAMAREVGPEGIRVNCVTPGLIQTDISAGKITDEKKAEIASSVPLNRLGLADDVAGAYLFLASDLSAYVTGAVIDVNGGMLIH